MRENMSTSEHFIDFHVEPHRKETGHEPHGEGKNPNQKSDFRHLILQDPQYKKSEKEHEIQKHHEKGQ